MAASRWIFTKEELANTPSRKSGIDADKELSYRQQAATLIQDMGQRLSVTQLCINTAIVYMHRFYMFQTFARFVRNEMAPACLFLAAKVEEQPRKLEHVIKVAHSCLHRDHTPAPDVKSEAYLEQAQTLVFNENILLQTLGFDVTVDHPHTNVVKLTQLVKASKDLSQTSYFLATNSLHMTTFSLQYRPTVVACVCIYLACKWSNWKIPRSNEGKEWFEYIDRSVTQEMLEDRYQEFLDILAKYPHKLRKKIMGMKGEHTEGITNEDLEPSVPAGSSSSRHDHRKEMLSDFRRDGMSKRDSSGKERGDSHATPSGQSRHGPQERKDGHHPDKREQSHNRDSAKHKDVKDIRELKPSSSDRKSIGHVRSAPDLTIESRSHSNTNHVSANIPKPGASSVSDRHRTDKPVVINDTESSSSVSHPAQPQPNVTSDPHKSKSETLNYKEYLKRKEQEKLEREKYLKMKLAAENDRLNKTFSEGDVKQEKNRPPKLNLSLNNHEERTNGNSKRNERPYEVNIKSPIKPHHNIKVKSPIKSSDLKQPKLEITKVHITPEKDGSDACSVNINSDPNLKKMVDNKGRQGASSIDIKTEPSEGSAPLTNHDRTNSPRVKVKPESPRVRKQESVGSPRIKLKMEAGNPVIRVKQEKTERLKEKDTVDSPSNDIELLPEHTSAPNFKIRELNYDPEKSNDSNASLKLPVKLEPGSGRSTPIISHIKSESGPGASPLKLKIITKGLKPDGEHSSSSSQHGSPHRRHYKHKHKSHKHSKDKHKDKHREHRDKHGTNGHSLKMSIKLSNIQGSDSKPKHDKHSKISVSDTSLNKNSNALDSGERQQPWSMTDLLSQSGGNPDATRKRRRTPTVDQNVDVRSQSKQARVETNRLRRSSSSHSVVSMELSDGEIDESSTNGPDSKLDPPVVNQLQERLQQMIDMTKRNVFALEQQKVRHVPGSHNSRGASSRPNIDRQQSGFDLEGMMWNCGSSEQPPLPPEAPPPLPMSPPPRHALPPPPPPM